MKRWIRSLSALGSIGGIGSILFGFLYAFTHGTTTQNKMERVLGLNEVDWGRIGILVVILLWAGLWAFGLRTRARMGRMARWGYALSSAALAIRFLSEVPQFLIDMRTQWLSPLGTSAWLLFLLSSLVLPVGMLLVGAGNLRTDVRGPFAYAPLLVGLLIIPTFLAEGIVSGLTDDGTLWRVIHASTKVPLGLAWSWLSLTAWRDGPIEAEALNVGEAVAGR